MHFLYQDKLKRNRSDTGAFFIIIIITVYLTNDTTVTRCLVQLPFAVYVSIGGTVLLSTVTALLPHCGANNVLGPVLLSAVAFLCGFCVLSLVC